jgi:hypothetical protein
MTAKPHPTLSPADAAALAATVRELARTAHRALHEPTADPAKLRELAHRIARLQARLSASSATPLDAWLESLSFKVSARESLARPVGPPRRGQPMKGRPALAGSSA